jgi:DNA-binding transcriptional ArsR family regulator
MRGRGAPVNQPIQTNWYLTTCLFIQLVYYRLMATDELSRTFAALADPTRRAILARLARGQATVNDLAEPFAMSLPAVSKHLQVLERAGLIARGRDAQWRPARLVAEPLAPAADWIDGYRGFWEHSFDQLENFLTPQKQEGTTND